MWLKTQWFNLKASVLHTMWIETNIPWLFKAQFQNNLFFFKYRFLIALCEHHWGHFTSISFPVIWGKQMTLAQENCDSVINPTEVITFPNFFEKVFYSSLWPHWRFAITSGLNKKWGEIFPIGTQTTKNLPEILFLRHSVHFFLKDCDWDVIVPTGINHLVDSRIFL